MTQVFLLLLIRFANLSRDCISALPLFSFFSLSVVVAVSALFKVHTPPCECVCLNVLLVLFLLTPVPRCL